jgi:cytochrome P450
MKETHCDDLGREFDHISPDHTATMVERAAELRERCPVARSEQRGGFWILSRYRDVVNALRKHSMFSSARGIQIVPYGRPFLATPTESDPPEHTDYRRIIWPFLTPAAVEGYEAFVRNVVADLIDAFIEDGQAEVIEQLAIPVPARVVGQFFGFTSEESSRCHQLLFTMADFAASDPPRAQAAVQEWVAFLQSLIDEARRHPDEANEVISAVVSADILGRPITNDECLGVINTTITGAIGTTVDALGSAIFLLGRHKASRQRLVDDPALIASAVEEILRIEAPAYTVARSLTDDCEVDGVNMTMGEWVLLLVGSANHDGARFEDPDAFVIDRPNNDHLAFGYGIHKCVGRHLAVLEIRVVIEEVLRRLPDYELIGDPSYSLRNGILWGVEALPIRFTPRVRASRATG